MRRSIEQGLVFFRWAAWLWMTIVLAFNNGPLVRPVVAWVLVAAAFGVSLRATLVSRRPDPRPSWIDLGVELAVAVALIAADGVVFAEGHVFGERESLNGIWPLAAVLHWGMWAGYAGAIGASVAVGIAHGMAISLNGATLGFDAIVNGVRVGTMRIFSLTGTVVVNSLAGVTATYVTRLLDRAEAQVASANARAEVARTLHDGVMQTLAIVERRTDDPALAGLVRTQERELRGYLFGDEARRDLPASLRRAASRHQARFQSTVDVVVAEDLPPLTDDRVEAVVGAVSEALTNASKHGAAQRIVVFAEPEGSDVFCSVKDDGAGFDPEAPTGGVGVRSSIRERIAAVGGRVEVESRPGAGTEVRMWVRSGRR